MHLPPFDTPLRHAAVAIALLLAANGSFAASFDCAKAGTPLENTICADPLLGSLDEALARNYAQLLATGPDVQATRRAQGRWLAARNRCQDVQCVVDAYRVRLDQTCGAASASAQPRCTRSADLLPPAPAASRTCPITARQLLGSWRRESGSALHEVMAFEDGPSRPFNAWLHDRPEVSGGLWELQDCTLLIEHPTTAALDSRSKVVGYDNGRLTLQPDGEAGTATYRRLAGPPR